MKFKLQYIVIQIPRLEKCKTLKILNIANFVEQLKLSYISDGSIKWYKHVTKSLILSHKVENISIMLLSNPTPINLHKRNLNRCSQKVFHKMVFTSFIYSSQNWKNAKLWFLNRFMQYNIIHQWKKQTWIPATTGMQEKKKTCAEKKLNRT